MIDQLGDLLAPMEAQREAAVGLYLADRAQYQENAQIAAEPGPDIVVSDDSDEVEVLSEPGSPEDQFEDNYESFQPIAITPEDLAEAGPSRSAQPPGPSYEKAEPMDLETNDVVPARLTASEASKSEAGKSEVSTTQSELHCSSPYLVPGDLNHDIGSIAEDEESTHKTRI